MRSNHIHRCTFFDDGDVELVCVCGVRGVYLVDDDAPDGMLVVVLDDADLSVDVTLTETAAPARTAPSRRELPVSA